VGTLHLERKRQKTGENHDSVEDVEEEERLVAEAKETAKAWVNSLVGDIDIAPK